MLTILYKLLNNATLILQIMLHFPIMRGFYLKKLIIILTRKFGGNENVNYRFKLNSFLYEKNKYAFVKYDTNTENIKPIT